MTNFDHGDFVLEETQAQQRESLLRSREIFFEPANLETHALFCGDERPSDEASYIQAFGGALNTVYNFRIMNEALEPGSTNTSFKQDTAAIVPLIKEIAHAIPGVHSQEEAEGGTELKRDAAEDVDCGYAKKRQAISELIATQSNAILSDTINLFPELFTNEEDRRFGEQVVNAHAHMADMQPYFTDGRQVIVTAVDSGAAFMVVRGSHSGKDGIINVTPNSTFDTNGAYKADLPTYCHNAWATKEVADRLHGMVPYDARQRAIAEMIDTVGTMRALGVETIAVRRPEA